MGALLRFFGGNYQLYFVIALVLALSTVSAGYFYQRGEAILYRDQAGVLQTQLKSAADALVTNAKAITDLQAGLGLWKASAEEATAAQNALLAKLDAQQHLIDQTKQKLAATEKTDNARPDCNKLLSLDLGAVCPGHVAAMRVRAANPTGVPGPGRQGVGPHPRSP